MSAKQTPLGVGGTTISLPYPLKPYQILSLLPHKTNHIVVYRVSDNMFVELPLLSFKAREREDSVCYDMINGYNKIVFDGVEYVYDPTTL